MTNSLPLVSIVTPVLNALEPLRRCIESVRVQDYPNIEHVVIDGGSSDGTTSMLEELAAGQSPAPLRFTSGPDVGVFDAMSRGVQAASGTFVHILNADDRYVDSGVLSKVIRKMVAEDLDLHHARARIVDEAGSPLAVIGRRVDRDALLKKMWVAHPTVVVRRSVYEQLGSFSVGYRLAGDHEFLLRVWDRVRVGYEGEVEVEMLHGGLSTRSENMRVALRESASAAVLHGRHPVRASSRYLYEVGKSTLIAQSVWRTWASLRDR